MKVKYFVNQNQVYRECLWNDRIQIPSALINKYGWLKPRTTEN